MLRSASLLELHDRSTAAWHLAQPQDAEMVRQYGMDSVEGLVARQHLANFELWHEEDKARSPEASDAEIAQVKHNIDRSNQRRHDVTEALDSLLLDTAEREGAKPEGRTYEQVPLHSETPGMMADRLSILSLKIFHTQEEMARVDAPAGHSERNYGRLLVLEEQRRDLAQCLETLWDDVLAGRRRFKLYRQLKMYNDAALNPAVYRAKAGDIKTGVKQS
jgi:hypothetical protein